VGPTGYIGKFVTRELVARGYDVVAFAREKSGIKGRASREDTIADFPGADVRFGDVGDPASLAAVAFGGGDRPVDAVVCCLASRTGGVADSWAIDYRATKNVLDAAIANGTSHFVLLSAICVQKPLLEFQKAKLALEADMIAAAEAGGPTYSIVRPTAFFKSLAGQVDLVKQGKPYVMFGDGGLAACKPISEADLARFMADCVADPAKANAVLPIGGPGRAWTAKEQGEMLFKLAGKDPKFIRVPVALMDVIIGALAGLAKVFPGLTDAAEFGRIGKYYATESMLVWDPATGAYDADATPEYGIDTLQAFFERAVQDGGMEGQELGDAGVF
jgi:divinyl chlorophyllide a 8-vinyl-reductase